MNLLLSFLYLLLHLAIILFVAAAIVWVLKWIGWPIDPTLYKIGQAIVGLLCLIVIVIWLAGLLGYAGARFPLWSYLDSIGYRLAYIPQYFLRI